MSAEVPINLESPVAVLKLGDREITGAAALVGYILIDAAKRSTDGNAVSVPFSELVLAQRDVKEESDDEPRARAEKTPRIINDNDYPKAARARKLFSDFIEPTEWRLVESHAKAHGKSIWQYSLVSSSKSPYEFEFGLEPGKNFKKKTGGRGPANSIAQYSERRILSLKQLRENHKKMIKQQKSDHIERILDGSGGDPSIDMSLGRDQLYKIIGFMRDGLLDDRQASNFLRFLESRKAWSTADFMARLGVLVPLSTGVRDGGYSVRYPMVNDLYEELRDEGLPVARVRHPYVSRHTGAQSGTDRYYMINGHEETLRCIEDLSKSNNIVSLRRP
ncbi:MAG TPA: hypothetical protein VG965_03175 [Patescibacteria group bacterium]|nr:hypothetical protein [Patescibacteria group bacterium]